MTTPIWLAEAYKHIGTREIPGVNHHPLIVRMWRTIKRAGIKDDETPWCAAFVGFCLENVGIRSTRFESARSYRSWGVALDRPIPGCIVVMSRPGGGHVGFVVGVDPRSALLVLGGNQDNEVSIRAFDDPDHIESYRWPDGVPVDWQILPIAEATAARSQA